VRGTECAIEAGKVLAIQYVVFGTIGKLGSTYTLTVNLADVETAAIAKSATYDVRGAIDDLLVPGMRTAAHKLLGLPVPAEEKPAQAIVGPQVQPATPAPPVPESRPPAARSGVVAGGLHGQGPRVVLLL